MIFISQLRFEPATQLIGGATGVHNLDIEITEICILDVTAYMVL
jgi:hypothetical protein